MGHRNLLNLAEWIRMELLPTGATPEPPKLIEVEEGVAVWQLQVPGQEPRFMSVRSGAINDEYYKVDVDAERFYRLWLRSSFRDPWQQHRCPRRSAMVRDVKFKHAVKGFSLGPENPVPLADIEAWHDEERGGWTLGFTNGVTRTLWLLANRCPAFPVEVHGEEQAKQMHQLVGIGGRPVALAEIFGR